MLFQFFEKWFNDYMFFQSLLTSILHYYSLYSFTVSSTNDVRVASGESAEAKEREGFKEGAKERERAHRASETDKQREERLNRSIRDRARCAVQSERGQATANAWILPRACA